MPTKAGLMRGVFRVAMVVAAVSAASCVEVADPYYADPYYQAPPQYYGPPPQYYGGGGYYGGGHGQQSDDRRRNRQRQSCNVAWSNCVAICNQAQAPAANKALCINNCNNGLNQCMGNI
jgi:hypothetical protein